jgi:hypothetical protein
MPELDQKAIDEWLASIKPPGGGPEWPPPIRPIETDAEIAPRLQALGRALDRAAQADKRGLSATLQADPMPGHLRAVIEQLGAGRMLRLLNWLAESGLPDAPIIINALLQAHAPSRDALRTAILAVTRHAMLARIFAPARVAVLADICNTMSTETA